MSFADRTIADFLDMVARGDSTPGGGAVAAVTGAAGAALGEMVCRLTIENRAGDSTGTRIADVRSELSDKRATLLQLADEDSAAVRAVLGGHQGSDWDRDNSPQRRIVEVPLETAVESLAVLERCVTVAEQGYAPAIGDAGAGAVLAHACCRVSIQNVRINLEHDEGLFDDVEVRAELDNMENAAERAVASVQVVVTERT